MATTTKKSSPKGKGSGSSDSSFDNGKTSRAQDRAYKDGILQMGQPVSRRPQIMANLLVWGSVALIIIFVVYNAIMANTNRSLNSSLSDTLKTQYNPSFKVRYADLGAEVINAWYSGKPAPVNVADGLTWNSSVPAAITGSAPVAAPNKGAALTVAGVAFSGGTEIESTTVPGRFEERLRYYALVNGVPYIIGVSIAIPNLDDINSVPTLIATPAILSKATISPDKTDKLIDPSAKMIKASISQQALSVVDTWAKAWTEDIPASLKSVTADPSPANTYRGLGGGWSYVPNSANISWSVVSPKDSSVAIARVTWQMRTPGTTIPDTSGNNLPPQVLPGATQTQTMDILVGKFNEGSPSVTAWGQAGTYPELKAYMNGISPKDAGTLQAPVAPAPSGNAATTTPTAPATGKPSSAATTPADNSK